VDWCLQNIHNKWVVAKIFVINKLAPKGIPLPAGLCLFLISISSIANWVKLKGHVGEIYISFVMCGLADFRELRGLDKILETGTEERRNPILLARGQADR
jgi:hypothetical protein